MTEDWYIANDDEKAQIFGMTTEVLNTADLGKYLENGGVYLDFFAQNTNTAETVNISVQKLQAVASIAASALDDQQYIDTVYDQMISSGADKQLFASLNITDGKIEKGTTTVAGVETPCLFISGTMNSNGAAIPVFETQIYKRKFGVSAVITSASYNTNTSENAFQMFE